MATVMCPLDRHFANSDDAVNYLDPDSMKYMFNFNYQMGPTSE